MVSLRLRCGIGEKDELIAELYGAGTSGIVEEEFPGGECALEAFFDTVQQAQSAAEAFATHQPEWVEHGQRNYVAEFQSHWQPIPVGRRFWLAAPWDDSPTPEGRMRLEYQAGMACGSGAHPCTRLCLAALETIVTPRSAVLDIGAGSGLLLMACALLGAHSLAGCDIDHESAVLAAQALPHAAVFTGSARCIRAAAFDVAVANISSIAAADLRADLLRICRPGGTILVSGFRTGDWPDGFEGERLELEGWAAIRLPRP